MTRTWVSAVMALTLAALPAAAQGPAPAASTASTIGAVDAGSVVDVDLRAGIFKDPLPFDVPFYIRGTRDATITSVSAKVLQFPAPVNCLEQEALFKTNPDAEGVVDKRGRREKDKVVLRDLGRATDIVDNNETKFLLLVPALPVNRSYCFRIVQRRKLSTAEASQFQEMAFRVVDEGLREVPPDVQQPTVYQQLRQEIIAQVQRQLPRGQVIEPPAGSFFDKGSALNPKYHTQFTKIVNFVDQLTDNRQEFRNASQPEAKRQLSALVGSGAYQRVTRALAEKRETSPPLDALLKEKPGALDLLDMRVSDMDNVAWGVAPRDPIPPLDQTFAPADLDPQLARLGDTVTGLWNLGDVISRLNRDQALRAAARLDDPEGQAALAALPVLVTAAKDAVDGARFGLQNVQTVLAERTAQIQQVVTDLRVEVEEVLPLVGSTLAGYELRASWYVSADVGLGVARDIDEVFPYMGANVYFTPVNKKAHLGPLFSSLKKDWRKRFALMIGLPQNTIQVPGRLVPVFQDRPLVLGAGLRLNDLLRLTAGGLVFKKENPDPLITSTDGLTATWFVSLSIDWDVRSSFVPIFKSLGLGSQGGAND